MILYDHPMSANCLKAPLIAESCAILLFLADGTPFLPADGRPFLAGEDYTVADIAVHAYVHCAGDAGADPREDEAIAAWLDRVEATPGFVNDLAPIRI